MKSFEFTDLHMLCMFMMPITVHANNRRDTPDHSVRKVDCHCDCFIGAMKRNAKESGHQDVRFKAGGAFRT